MDTGLRALLTDCSWEARSSNAISEVALGQAPNEFQLDLLNTAMHHQCDSTFSFDDMQFLGEVDRYYLPYAPHRRNNPIGALLYSQDFENPVYFAFTDSTRHGFIHLPSLGKTTSCEQLSAIQCKSACELKMNASSFNAFASWLYFDSKLREILFGGSASRGVDCLLDYYKAARSLLRVASLPGVCPKNHSGVDLVELLHFQAARFKDEVVEALAVHWEERGTVPSDHQIATVYNITEPTDDPLRRLVADLYVWYGTPDTLRALCPDFHYDLCNSLMIENKTLRTRSDDLAFGKSCHGKGRYKCERLKGPIEKKLRFYKDQAKYQILFEEKLDKISKMARL